RPTAARRGAGAPGRSRSAGRGPAAWTGRWSWVGCSWAARGGGEDGFQPPEGADVALLGGFFRDAQHLGRLRGGELLEVPQRQHLAVERVDDLERPPQPRLPLGAAGRGAGARGPAERPGGQRGRDGGRP